MTTTPPLRPVISTQLDLELAWRRLMEPLGFSGSSIWVMLIGDDDRPFPHLSEIVGDDLPTDEELGGLAAMVDMLLTDVAPHGRVAFLRSRPGADGPRSEDRAWANALLTACRARGVACDVVHLATDVAVTALPYDELAASA